MKTSTRKVLRWRKVKPPTGLAAVGWSGHGNLELTLGGEPVGSVSQIRATMFGEVIGWYWTARVGDQHTNRAADLRSSCEAAKAECIAWVRERLADPS